MQKELVPFPYLFCWSSILTLTICYLNSWSRRSLLEIAFFRANSCNKPLLQNMPTMKLSVGFSYPINAPSHRYFWLSCSSCIGSKQLANSFQIWKRRIKQEKWGKPSLQWNTKALLLDWTSPTGPLQLPCSMKRWKIPSVMSHTLNLLPVLKNSVPFVTRGASTTGPSM